MLNKMPSKNNNNEIIHLPRELSIILNTTIPGFGKFFYTSNMTSLNRNVFLSKYLLFNPKIRLQGSFFSKIPDYTLQVAHFYNKQLNKSMIYESMPNQPVELEEVKVDDHVDQATLISEINDNINHNVHIILSTIFKSGEMITIGGTQYTILFYAVREDSLPQVVGKFDNKVITD
jgi:hypothetical protein